MYLELRTWQGSWFGGETAIRTRPFGCPRTPSPELLGVAAATLRDEPPTRFDSPAAFPASAGDAPPSKPPAHPLRNAPAFP